MVHEGWKDINGPALRARGSSLQWTLFLGTDSDGYLCVGIKTLQTQTPTQVQVAIDACILDVDNKRVSNTGQPVKPESFTPVENCVPSRLMRRELVLQNPAQYLPGKKLSVVCIIHYLELGTYAADRIAKPFPVISPPDGSTFMKNILTEGLFTDVVVAVGDQEFPVHKAVLAERSEVFRAMFNTNMTESTNKHVIIEDMTADVASDLLTFIYTDMAPNIGDSARAEELLAAAEKYNIPRLKTICEAELAKCLDSNNAIATLVMSDTYRADQLEKMTLHWMARHAGDVVEGESWESFCNEHPQLLKVVCREFASYISTLKAQL